MKAGSSARDAACAATSPQNTQNGLPSCAIALQRISADMISADAP